MHTLSIEYSTERLDAMQPNNYNPNKMNERQFSAELESIQHFGFIDPITVRDTANGLIIVDGEHRWRGAKEIIRRIQAGEVTLVKDAQYDENRGWTHPTGRLLNTKEASPAFIPVFEGNAVPVANLGRISDTDAKRLTVILNETRGTSNAVDLAEVLAQIQEGLGGSLDDLQLAMPYVESELDQLLSITGADFGDLTNLEDDAPGGPDFLQEFSPENGESTQRNSEGGYTEGLEEDDDESTPSHKDEVAEALGTAYFTLTYPVTEEQRSIIIRALSLVKSEQLISNSVEALIWMAMHYLKTVHNEEPNYEFERKV